MARGQRRHAGEGCVAYDRRREKKLGLWRLALKSHIRIRTAKAKQNRGGGGGAGRTKVSSRKKLVA